MKTLTLTLIFVLLFTLSALGVDMWKLAFNSAVETDRYQSHNWHFSTKENPMVSPNGFKAYEGNILVAGTNREQFNTRVDIGKGLTNSIREYNKYTELGYKIITVIELLNSIRNNLISEHYGFEKVYIISYNFRF